MGRIEGTLSGLQDRFDAYQRARLQGSILIIATLISLFAAARVF